jgi:hypothetical protein
MNRDTSGSEPNAPPLDFSETASMLKARKFRWNYRLTSCGFLGNLLYSPYA